LDDLWGSWRDIGWLSWFALLFEQLREWRFILVVEFDSLIYTKVPESFTFRGTPGFFAFRVLRCRAGFILSISSIFETQMKRAPTLSLHKVIGASQVRDLP
jgi:hypothetical protein